MFHVFLIATYLSLYVEAANWAQSSGDVDQIVTLPAQPSKYLKHWGKRHGHAVLRFTTEDDPIGSVFLLGGDTYFGPEQNWPIGQLDVARSNGYKNDVWKMSGTDWQVQGDLRLRTDHHQKIPRVSSNLNWELTQAGLAPPPGTTYDEWISCEDYFLNKLGGANCTENTDVQWSPRRNHVAIVFGGYMWVMGGRSREYVELARERSVGGIIGPRVGEIPQTQLNARDQHQTTKREASVYKSDVWRSTDGQLWKLVTPGCRAPQKNLIAEGNERENKEGTVRNKCTLDEDCYGAERCTFGTCQCFMWSSREQFTIAAYGEAMYVSGGFASRLFSHQSNCGAYACGDTDASAYRFYLNDVWMSTDGEIWTAVTQQAEFPGRGGHQMIYMKDINGDDYLWIFGGRGGDPSTGELTYYNDTWTSPVAALADESNPLVWTEVTSSNRGWSPRVGHTITLEEESPMNFGTRKLYCVGGFDGEEFLDETWSWRPDVPGDYWRKDFTPEAIYSYGSDSSHTFANNSPAVHSVTPDSPLRMLQRFWVPDRIKKGVPQSITERVYINDKELEQLASLDIHTIRELASADKYAILKLRGFDVPQVALEDRMDFYSICDKKILAMAVVEKCTAPLATSLYEGERNAPWNIVPEFGGPPPQYAAPQWYGRNWTFMNPPETDDVVVVDEWDGCAYLDLPWLATGHRAPNVIGLGNVDQVEEIRDPLMELQDIQCRQTPNKRAYHAAVMLEERLYVMGGKASEEKFYADTWYRDDSMPVAKISHRPGSNTPLSWFEFASTEAGVSFEYRIWDPINYKQLRAWTAVVHKTSVEWLDWRKGGPGNGEYEIYVRAVDPSGNRDKMYIHSDNVYRWYYLSPTPWDIIFGSIGGFIAACIIAYAEYRRRVKKAAMERYAMKRMRRKFKAMQRDVDGRAVDWRTLYNENKNADANASKKKKEKRKKRDGLKDQLEKDKKKREKDKERIKKKLKASKDHKEKKKASDAPPPAIEDGVKKKDKGGGTKSKKKSAGGSNGVDFVLEGEKPDKGGPDEKAARASKTDAGAGSKFKDYEKKQLAQQEDPAESGTKQRKTNKKYKDYEQGGKKEDEQKKEM